MSRGDSFLCAVIFGRFPCLLVTCCSLGTFSCVKDSSVWVVYYLTSRSHPWRNIIGRWNRQGRFFVIYMDVSENSEFSPQIIHFKRVFHYKPSILRYPYFWKHPCVFYVCRLKRFFCLNNGIIIILGGAGFCLSTVYPGKFSINPKPAVRAFFWGKNPDPKPLPHILPTTASASHFEGLEKRDHSNDRESNYIYIYTPEN